MLSAILQRSWLTGYGWNPSPVPFSFCRLFWALSEECCIWFFFCQDGDSVVSLCAKHSCGNLSKADNLISLFSESKERASLLTRNVLILCWRRANIILLNVLKNLSLSLRSHSPSVSLKLSYSLPVHTSLHIDVYFQLQVLWILWGPSLSHHHHGFFFN